MQLGYKSNIQEVINRQLGALNVLTANNSTKRNQIFNSALFSVHSAQKERIFTDGKDENGRLFGTYDKAYLKIRTKYHWSNTNINLDLTDETMNGYIIGDTPNGMGFGYLNKANGSSKSPNGAQKSIYLEDRFGSFFNMSYKENAIFLRVINETIASILRGKIR